MPEVAIPTVRRMRPHEARRVAKRVRVASQRLPDRRARILGKLLPTWLLACFYRWVQATNRGEVWIAETPTAMAGVMGLWRGSTLEAVDFFSTGERLGLVLSLELLRRVDHAGRTVSLDVGGHARESYFRRLGFEPAGGTRMVRRPGWGAASDATPQPDFSEFRGGVTVPRTAGSRRR